MKLKTILITFAAVAVAAGAFAQNPMPRKGHRQTGMPVNSQAATTAEQSLSQAISLMTAALPIYDGYRVKSIHQAHQALVILEKATAPGRTPRQKPQVKDHVPSKHAHAKYTADQIAASQNQMNQGLQALQAASNALASAGSNKRTMNAAAKVQTAISDAATALSIHANGANRRGKQIQP